MAKKNRLMPVVSDAEWRARSDAQTLIDAEKIRSDKARLSAARKQLKTLIAEAEQARADAEKVSKQ